MNVSLEFWSLGSGADGVGWDGASGYGGQDPACMHQVVGDGGGWTVENREGAQYASSATSNCQGTGADLFFWTWLDTSGNPSGFGCGATSGYNMIGTACANADNARPTRRYNMMFMGAGHYGY